MWTPNPIFFYIINFFLHHWLSSEWVPTACAFLSPCAKSPISPLSLESLSQFPLSLLLSFRKDTGSQNQTGQNRHFSWSETQVSLSWFSPVSCWGFAAGCLQHFMKNIFHYIFHFQLSTFLSCDFRLKQQDFCTAYLVQYDLSVSCWKESVDVKAKSQNPAVIHLQPHPRNLTSSQIPEFF